jgi:predicted dienelactone hydrolase
MLAREKPMKFSIRILATLLAVISSVYAAQRPAIAGENVGVRQMAFLSKARGVSLDVTIWYPADAGGQSVTLGDSAFFVGTPAMLDAPISRGKYPLILLSHGAGLGGNAAAMSWIAAPLAKQGFVVAAPTHPGNTGPHRSAAETMKLWLRPTDISETLDAMHANAFFNERLELERVGMLGLSMGGSTALQIAGARIDPRRLASYCDTDAFNASLCGWVRQSGVDLHAMDLTSAAGDNRDNRITFAMAIDPAPVDVFEFASFGPISIAVDLINLGKIGKIPPTTAAASIAAAIPHSTYSVIEDASHYSMFAECRPGARELAASEQIGDPICADGGGRARAEIHAQLIDMAVDAFGRALKPTL